MKAIIGKKWILETINGAPARPGVGGGPLHIQLNEDGQLSGFAGCNRFFGTVEMKGDKISVGRLGSTKMACPPEFDDAELLQVLEKADQAATEAGRLLLKHQGTVIATFVEEGAAALPAAELRNTRWVLRSLHGEPVALADDPWNQELFLQFPLDAEDQVQGYAGCNSFRGTFTLNDNSLTFGPLMSTRRACPNLELEGQYLKALETTDEYRIEGDVLTLTSKGEVVAVFQAINN